MSQLTIVNRSQLLAGATAISAVGFLTLAPPVQAHPMLPFPLAPACSQWGFPGLFALKQTVLGQTVSFTATGPNANGAMAEANDGEYHGAVTGGITGDNLDFTIPWRGRGAPDDAALLSKGRYQGSVGSDGFAHGETHDELANDHSHWDSTVPLVCITTAAPAAGAAAPPAPAAAPAPPAAAAAARLGVNATGPTTLKTGMTSGYTVTVSNPGELSAPVELFISFNGNLRQTGQPTPSGGFDCTVNNYAGGTSSVHCTVGQFGSKATANIAVQGQGSAPGAGQLVVNINSSDPAAQFVQKSQQLNVSIT
ncbi:MAG: hypothetical protein QOG14_1325 [Mycobacterium sp.]|jgi:hypothetical protein|nr:hypothetical protein [Mycobacterium sp.]